MPILQERQDKNTIKIFMKHSVPVEIKKIINVFTFYSLIFMLRVLSSAIEPAVRFLRTVSVVYSRMLLIKIQIFK